MATFCACSSALCRRLVRISATARAAPGRPGCRARRPAPSPTTKPLTSATWVRSPSARRAAPRPMPICISCRTRANSSASGPSVLRATWDSAASKPSPDSTEIVSRSSASGSARCMASGAVVALLVQVHVRRHVAGDGERACTTPSVVSSPKPNSMVTTRPEDQGDDEADELQRGDPVDAPARAGCRRPRACAGSARCGRTGVSFLPMPEGAVARAASSTRSWKDGSSSCAQLRRGGGERLDDRQATCSRRVPRW